MDAVSRQFEPYLTPCCVGTHGGAPGMLPRFPARPAGRARAVVVIKATSTANIRP